MRSVVCKIPSLLCFLHKLCMHMLTQPLMTMQVTQHGACLGLGLAGLGTDDQEIFEDVKNVLYTDSAIAGEAAGLALGLLCVGSASDKAAELLAYAHDTQHEKVCTSVQAGGSDP